MKGTWIAILVGLLCAKSISAFEPRPYFGADFQIRNMRYVTGFGSELFKKRRIQNNLFFGCGLNDIISVEGGNTTTHKIVRSVHLYGPHLGAGPLYPPETIATIRKISSWNAGVLVHYDIFGNNQNPQLISYIGLSRVKFYHHIFTLYDSNPDCEFVPVPLTMRSFVHRRTVLKLGVGLQFSCDCCGIRFMLGYEGTGRSRHYMPQEIRSKMSIGIKDSIFAGVGIFMYLPGI